MEDLIMEVEEEEAMGEVVLEVLHKWLALATLAVEVAGILDSVDEITEEEEAVGKC